MAPKRLGNNTISSMKHCSRSEKISFSYNFFFAIQWYWELFPHFRLFNENWRRRESILQLFHSSYGDINHIYLGCISNSEKINRFYFEISKEIPAHMNILSLENQEMKLSNKILKHILVIRPLTKYD